MRASTAVVLVVLVGLAGCAGLAPPGADGSAADDGELGVVSDVEHNQSLPADEQSELTESELDQIVNRTMVRLERERGLTFDRRPHVEVMSREEFRSEDISFAGHIDRFESVRWQATHIVGDDDDVGDAFGELYGGAVQGYYSSRDGGTIVLIVDDDDAFTLPRETLVHELVHALQDQQLTLWTETETTDEELAWEGLVEGEADLLAAEYENRCTTGEWDCVPGAAPESSGREYNRGLFVSIFLGYGEGPSFVAHLRDRGGWEGVNEAYDDPPQSTAAVIEPDRYPFDPESVTVQDRSSSAWEPIEEDGAVRTDTLGAASLYAMFWHHGVIDEDHFWESDSSSGVTYNHPLVTGWTGDQLVVYERGDDDGYVLRTTWTDATEAERFADGYRNLLDELDAEAVDGDRYRVDAGGFAGGYHVDQDGETVTIVHAPSVAEVEGVHAPTATSASVSDAATAAARSTPQLVAAP